MTVFRGTAGICEMKLYITDNGVTKEIGITGGYDI